MTDQTMRAFAPVVLRFGLAILFVWFGASEVLHVAEWTSWVPAWATALTHLSVERVVLLNGSFELIAGVLLAVGLYVRPVAFLLAVHMALIVIDIGFDQIGIRDLAILFATLALALGGSDWLTLDRVIK